MLLWRGGAKAPLEVRVVLGDTGAGWFKLERYSPTGAYDLAGMRSDGAKVDGDAMFAFSDTQLKAWAWSPLSLRLSILAGNPAKADMEVFLAVLQPQGVLTPQDIHGNGLQMKANGLSLGKIQDNQPGLFDFQVLFW